jgi:FtsZ-binding cell division protein ZapB
LKYSGFQALCEENSALKNEITDLKEKNRILLEENREFRLQTEEKEKNDLTSPKLLVGKL